MARFLVDQLTERLNIQFTADDGSARLVEKSEFTERTVATRQVEDGSTHNGRSSDETNPSEQEVATPKAFVDRSAKQGQREWSQLSAQTEAPVSPPPDRDSAAPTL